MLQQPQKEECAKMNKAEYQTKIAAEIRAMKARAEQLDELFLRYCQVEETASEEFVDAAEKEHEGSCRQGDNNPQCGKEGEKAARKSTRRGVPSEVSVESVHVVSDASFSHWGSCVFGSANSPADWMSRPTMVRRGRWDAADFVDDGVARSEEAVDAVVDLSEKVQVGDRVILVKEPYHGRVARVKKARGTGDWTLVLEDKREGDPAEVYKMKCHCWLMR